MNESRSLAGKVALVSGAGSGIGYAVAQRYLGESASVVVLERDPEKAERLATELPKAVVVKGDVSSKRDNIKAVSDAVRAFGRLDIVVANAGVLDNFVAFEQIPLDVLGPSFDELFGVNVKGHLLTVRAALPQLIMNRGCIIFTASVAGLEAGNGGVLYTASKHAVIGIVKQLAQELATKGIRVNAIAPGYVSSEMHGITSLGQGRRPFLSPREVEDKIPLKLVPNPNDFTDLYVFLASEKYSRVITGAVIVADGGTLVRGGLFSGKRPS